MNDLFLFLVFGIVLYLGWKSIKKARENYKKLEESIRKLFETFNNFTPQLKDEFYSELKSSQRKHFERYLQAFLNGRPIKVNRMKSRDSQSVQLLYRWMMKKNLESNFKVYSALKEEHQNSIKTKLKPKSQKLFEKVFELYNVTGEIPFKNMGRILKYGFFADFVTNMESYRNSFIDLTGQVQHIMKNNMDHAMDSQMFNDMNQMNNFDGFENMQMAMQQEFQSIMDQQFQQFSLEEAMKIVTPFDHGGYLMGPGFNPSDTMAFDAQQDMMQQIDMMNDMMHQMDMMNDMMHQMNMMNDMVNQMNQMNDMMNHMNHMNDMHNHNHF